MSMVLTSYEPKLQGRADQRHKVEAVVSTDCRSASVHMCWTCVLLYLVVNQAVYKLQKWELPRSLLKGVTLKNNFFLSTFAATIDA
jgi:hypothetical protein